MLAVLIIIGVIGIGLPAGLWLIARWRKAVPEKPQVYGEIDEWLLSEYGLGLGDRSLVREAVLGRYAAVTALDLAPRTPSLKAPVSLRPELLAPAHGLASKVAADGFRMLRVARRGGWVQLATGAVFIVGGICALAAGWGCNRFSGTFVVAVIDAAILVPTGVYNALIVPRRRRRSALSYLTKDGPPVLQEPGAP
jgi:hypothetical protein